MSHAAEPQVSVHEAMVALTEFAGSKRHELTELEARMWLAFVERVDAAKFLRFLVNWGMRSPFMPSPSDAAKALGVVATPDQAFESAMREVASLGPYRSPDFKDAGLRRAVVLMGGWARFCEEAPAPANEFAYGQFRKRFTELYLQAQSEVEVQGLEAPQLVGLANDSEARRFLANANIRLSLAPADDSPPTATPSL